MSVGNTLGYNRFPIPVGCMMPYAGTGTLPCPVGYLVCDGSLYNDGDYPELVSSIGGLYAQGGDPPNTFRVPNCVGKLVVGTTTNAGVSNPTSITGGQIAGYLTEAQMPTIPGTVSNLNFTETFPIAYHHNNGNYQQVSDVDGFVAYTSGFQVSTMTAGITDIQYEWVNPTVPQEELIVPINATGVFPASVTMSWIIRYKSSY